MRGFVRIICVVVCLGSIESVAQDAINGTEAVARLSRELQETRAELADSRRQIQELRQDLTELDRQLRANHSLGDQAPSTTEPSSAEPTVAAADQDTSFLAAKIAELHQDKVESQSRYLVKISGLVLFNSYVDGGNLDVQDLPSLAFPKIPGVPNGSFGATLRQTLLGIDVTGPKLFGAQSSASAEVDFGGGSPTTAFGVTAGLVRLRTAKFTLDWAHTSLNVGQDVLFFSPLSPTSYATLLEPALSWSGNLWVWTPQVEMERRFALNSESTLVLQGGILDPLTEEEPPFQGRTPTAGEATRTPAFAGRIALDRSTSRYPFSVGFGGYRARQQYDALPEIASWTLNGDLKASLGSHLELSGEWYKGQAVGGLGGGIWTSAVYPEPTDPHSAIHPLRSTGGWAQLKVKPGRRFEFNGAFGQDENEGRDLRFFPTSFTDEGYTPLKKNRTDFVNFIYKPNAFLLFAVEYRHLFTVPVVGESASGDQLNIAAGVRF